MKFKLSLLIWALVMAIAVAMWVTAKPSSTQSVAASTGKAIANSAALSVAILRTKRNRQTCIIR